MVCAPRLTCADDASWDSDSDDSSDDDNEDGINGECFSSIRTCGGITELHCPGVMLDCWVEGAQVDARSKETVLWAAGWGWESKVDLRVVFEG